MMNDYFRDAYNLEHVVGRDTLPVVRGTAGLGSAIAYFSSLGLPVLLPLNDNQAYDLAVDVGGRLERVDCKVTNRSRGNGTFIVDLRKTRTSCSETRNHPFNSRCVDFVFVLTSTNQRYLIPSEILRGRGEIRLNDEFDQYKIW